MLARRLAIRLLPAAQDRRLIRATAGIVVVASVAVAALARASVAMPPYAFVYARHTTPDTTVVFAVRADGSDERALTDGHELDLPVTWSPDATRIALEQLDASRTYSAVYTVGLDNAPPARVGISPYDEVPAWSPDGRWLAYQQQTDYGSGGGVADTTFDLWVAHADGSGLVRIGSGGTDGSSADWVGEGLGWEWSPDAKKIAFVETTRGAFDEPTGEAPVQLAVVTVPAHRMLGTVGPLADPQANIGWAWSADAQHVAAYRASDNRLAVLNPNSRAGTETYSVAHPDNGVGWEWSPRGSSLALVQKGAAPGARQLVIVDTATHRKWTIPSMLPTLHPRWIWSPDGTRLALFRAGSLLVADVRHRRLDRAGPAGDAAWSPDGRSLAVSSCAGVRLLRPGSGWLAVDRNRNGCDHALRWSPGGALLAFTKTSGGSDRIDIVARDGSRLGAATPSASADDLEWPATCRGLFRYGREWIVVAATGGYRLVDEPAISGATRVTSCQ